MNWNLVAAILGIVAGALTTIAATLLFIQEPSLANGCGLPPEPLERCVG
jgi:hypothetical protein